MAILTEHEMGPARSVGGPAAFLAEAGARGAIDQALSAARAHGAEARLGVAAGDPARARCRGGSRGRAGVGARADPDPESTPLGSVRRPP